MNIEGTIFSVITPLFAVLILYRAIKKKSWCPDICGSGSCSVNQKNRENSTANIQSGDE